MKIIPTAVRGVLERRTAIETVIFIGIEWTPGNEVFYSSHPIEGMRNNLLSLGGLETFAQLDGSGASQTAQVILSDTSGEIKNITSSLDVHKVPARVYLSFADIPATEKVLLLDGQVNSPMVWAEGDRTFSFNILTRIESSEVGFSIQDGFFPEGDQQQRSAVWPTRFGTTCAYPALRLTSPLKGFLGESQGVLDPTIDLRICQLQQVNCPKIAVAISNATVSRSTLDVVGSEEQQLLENPQLYLPGQPLPRFLNVDWVAVYFPDRPAGFWPIRAGEGTVSVPDIFSLDVPTGVLPLEPASNGLYVSRPDPACVRDKFAETCQLLRDKANQMKYIKQAFIVKGGDRFPQGVNIRIKIDGAVFFGSMVGEMFFVSSAIHPDFKKVEGRLCMNIGPSAVGFRRNLPLPSSLEACSTPSESFDEYVVGGATEGWRAVADTPSSKFLFLPSGKEVLLESSSTQIHVVSTIPGVVTQVLAYRSFADTRVLTVVPTEYYSVRLSYYGAFTVSEVWLDQPLSTIEGENWGDDIYTSFVSDVGPNPVDTIQWIIENYTSLVVDSVSFAAVRALLVKYPANFVLSSKEDAIRLISAIARQARCALTLVGNTVSIVYLSLEPETSRFIRRADIEVGSFQVSLSETEQIKTKHVATFKETGVPLISVDPAESSVQVVNANIIKYGVTESTENYFTITNAQQALKTATFWSIREGNTWKRVEFLTTLQQIDFDAFDAFILDIPQFPQVKCVVESSQLQGDQVKIVAWTPVLAGTNDKYLWAWPAAAPAGIRYPGPAVDTMGLGPQIIVQDDHPLAGYAGLDKVVTTYGDPFPSDLGDITPPSICKDPVDSGLIDDIQPQFDRFENRSPTVNLVRASAAEEIEAQELRYSFKDDKENKGCAGTGSGLGSLTCFYEVRVSYIKPFLVTTDRSRGIGAGCAGPCTPARGFRGRACAGSWDTVCHSFGSYRIAAYFAASKRAEGQWLFDNCGHFNGTRALYAASSVVGPTISPNSTGGARCESGDVGPVGPAEPQGEVFQPVAV